jgi:S1-C subfamily serine protease
MGSNTVLSGDRRTRCGYAAIFVAALAMLSAPLYAQQEADFQKLLADKASAIVTVKFVLKVKSTWGESDNEQEASGVMIEPHGLVLCSNTMLGGYSVWARHAGGTSTPTDIKVLVGDDTEGLEAELIARDSELDLTWVRIKDPRDKEFTCVDLNASAAARIGERLYSVSRLGRYFDRVPFVSEGRVGGITSKPRRLYIPSDGAGALGLPVYNAAGNVIGVLVSQMPEPDEMEGAGSSWYYSSAMILPAPEVLKATRRAKEVAAHDEEAEDQAAETRQGDE